MRFVLLAIWAFILGITPSGDSWAQNGHDELKGFWSNGDARNWDRPVTPNSSQGVSYRNYPAVVDRLKAEEEALKALPISAQPQQNPQQNQQKIEAPATPPPVSTPLSREQILSKFGAPDQPQLIRAQKDSPPAMQGLFEALNSNDKELAWQYAVALAKRQVEMQNVVSKATDYQLLAMEALGLRPPAIGRKEGEAIDPIRNEVKDLMVQTRQAELMRQVPIDPNLGQDSAAGDGAAVPARAALQAPQIPVDPEGKVKLLVFLDEMQPEAKQLAESITPLRNRLKSIPDVSVVGLTKRTYSPAGLKLRGAELSFPFPLLSGEALALELRIQSYPTFVFVAVTSRQTYRVEGIPTPEEIEKTVKVMRGGR